MKVRGSLSEEETFEVEPAVSRTGEEHSRHGEQQVQRPQVWLEKQKASMVGRRKAAEIGHGQEADSAGLAGHGSLDVFQKQQEDGGGCNHRVPRSLCLSMRALENRRGPE